MSERPTVVVAGGAQTRPQTEDPRSVAEIVLEAVDGALMDARVGFPDIDAVVTASIDLFDGQTASNMTVTEVVGAVMKPETRVAGDGLAALAHAACQIWAEAYETVLVVGHCKSSMAAHHALTSWAMDPIYLQPLGVNFLTCAALQACALAEADAGAMQRWADTAAARRSAAGAHALLDPCSAEDVLGSPVVAAPLHRDMCAPLGDGACAVVLRRVRGDAAPAGAVRLTGIGHDLAPHELGDRDLTAWTGLTRAYARACEVAGITEPATAFDLLEPSCFYAHEEDLFHAATGLSDRSAVSPGGGLFAGAVPIVAGLSRLGAAMAQLTTDPTCRRALVHGAWGPAGQGQVVAIVEAT